VKAVSISERLARDRRLERPGTINLMARAGRVEDLAHCYALFESFWLQYAEACWRVLPKMWRTLLSDGRMQLFLVENRAKSFGSRIVSFNATVFATDEFCCEARSTLPPYLGVQIVQHYLSHELPLLNREQVARANARRGLNVMLCFEGWERDGLSRDEVLAVREKQSEAFHLAHRGYRVKEFLADPVDEEELHWMLDAGARVRRDYSVYFEKHRVPLPETSQRPRLVGLTKEEAFANPGSYLSSFFIYSPPRFHFNRSEQSLLHRALMGETSEELAASLFISPWTVKKRWHAIYERIADVDRELLPPPVANSPGATSRGTERRRHLLHYLRQHPEELRPFNQ
jgi:DNA-binding CsgD family transcriptional regulator